MLSLKLAKKQIKEAEKNVKNSDQAHRDLKLLVCSIFNTKQR